MTTGYETIYIFSPEASDSQVKAVREKIEKIIKGDKGKLVAWDDLGLKKYAYPINNDVRGRYFYIAYTSNENTPREIERNLKIEDTVVRYMTVKISDDFNEKEFMKNYAGKSLLEGSSQNSDAPAAPEATA